jgi:hypothetical protein
MPFTKVRDRPGIRQKPTGGEVMSAESETSLLDRIPSTGLPEFLGASSGTGNPPPLMPDIWLAAITAAMQAHVDLSTTTQPVPSRVAPDGHRRVGR